MKPFLAGLTLVLVILAGSSFALTANAARPGNVYTQTNAASNSVLQFQTGPGGSLSLVGSYPTGGSGTGARLASQGAVTLTQDGQWLLTVNAGSNQISAFGVTSNGDLTLASVVGSEGTAPISVTTHGDLAYVLNNGTAKTPGNIAGFSISGSGQLSFISGSVQPLSGAANTSPEQIGFNSMGNVLVVTEKAAGVIDSYTVGPTGLASAPLVTPSNSAGPYGFAFSPQGYLILSEAAAGTLSSYAVYDGDNLRTISGSLPDFGLAPCWVAISPDGQYAYAANAHGGTISGYAISPMGTMTLFSSVAAHASIPTLDLAFGGAPMGQFLFALNGNSITGFQTYPDGSISQVSSVGGLPSSATGLAAT